MAVYPEQHPYSDFSELILRAFRIEHNMLHPAFTILFHVLEEDTEDISPEEDYQNHIKKFTHAVKKHLEDKPELVLVREILSNMWERNRELAIACFSSSWARISSRCQK